MPSHQFLEHTGEARLLVRGASLAEVFEEAARALGSLEREDIPAVGTHASGSVRLESRDAQALLVDWLNELTYWSEMEGAVPVEVSVGLEEAAAGMLPCRLAARFTGPRLAHRPALVKAATHHGLRLEQTAEGWQAEVVLDV